MGNNISKASDNVLARTTFRMIKLGIRHSYKDYLAIEILYEDGSLARQLLLANLSEADLAQITARISSLSKARNCTETLSVEEFMCRYRARLADKTIDTKRITSADILCDILADRATATSQILELYGITCDSIKHQIDELRGEF